VATDTLSVRITAETEPLRRAFTVLQQQLDRVRATGAAVGSTAAAGVQQLNTRLSQTAGLARNIAASLGVGFSAVGLVRAADEAAQMTAKLTLATKATGGLQIAQQGVFSIAQRTRTTLAATVDLYARIERSTREQKVNQATILQLTETINQAAKLSGGGASAEAALFQLSQGLASGTLRGEELNSVLEQTPRLAQAIADGMGIPIGKLRQIAQEGKLTSDAVLRAVLSQSKAIREEFETFPPTIADGFTSIRNALVQYISQSDQAGTTSRNIADALQSIAANLPNIIALVYRLGPLVLAVYTAFKTWPLIVGIVAAVQAAIARFNVQMALSTPLMRAASAQATILAGSMTALGPASAIGATGAVAALGRIRAGLGVLIAAFAGWQIGSYLSDQFLEARLAGLALVVGLDVAFKTLAGGVRQIGVTIREVFVGAFNYVLGRAEAFYRALGAAAERIPGIGSKASALYGDFADTLASSRQEAEGIANAFKRVYDETEAAKEAARQMGLELADAQIAGFNAKETPGTGGDIGIANAVNAGAASLKELAKLAKVQADLVVDEVSRALAQLQRLYDQGKVSIRDYFAEKARLETQSIDAQLEAARAELRAASGTDEVAAANANIIKLMRDRKAVSIDAIEAQRLAEKELAEQMSEVDARILQAQGQGSDATRARLEKEFLSLKLRLQAEGDAAGEELVNKLINLETLDSRLTQAGQRIGEALQRFQGVEAATGAQVSAGMLAQSDAEERIRQQRESSLAVLIRQREELAAVAAEAARVGDSFTLERANSALQELDGNIATLAIDTEALGYKAAQVLQGSLTQLFEDLASGSKSAGEALQDFVLNFVRGMAQIAAQALATYLVLQLLDAIYPGLGKLVAAGGGAAAGVPSNHSGGMAGSGASRRVLPALAFAGAPRYHSGGIAGLAADEVPSILRKDEEILTRQDPRHRYNQGGTTETLEDRVRFVFVDDQRNLNDYLESPRGERTIVKIMQRNPQ